MKKKVHLSLCYVFPNIGRPRRCQRRGPKNPRLSTYLPSQSHQTLHQQRWSYRRQELNRYRSLYSMGLFDQILDDGRNRIRPDPELPPRLMLPRGEDQSQNLCQISKRVNPPPVVVLLFDPNPPKPELCCWLLFDPKNDIAADDVTTEEV